MLIDVKLSALQRHQRSTTIDESQTDVEEPYEAFVGKVVLCHHRDDLLQIPVLAVRFLVRA